jgi:prephenate dehydratase
VVPVWNSTIGDVTEACAALDERAARIVRDDEVDVPVRHCLLALPGASLRGIRFVGSHPAALSQCSRLFDAPRRFVPCSAFNTAGAALELSRFNDSVRAATDPWYAHLPIDGGSQLAAIASARAAHRYGLVILHHEVQDDPTNVTRFAVVRALKTHRDRTATSAD